MDIQTETQAARAGAAPTGSRATPSQSYLLVEFLFLKTRYYGEGRGSTGHITGFLLALPCKPASPGEAPTEYKSFCK